MSGCTALEEALAQGGRVIFEADRPRLLVPKGMRDKIQEDIATVREVLRRATLFRGQANSHGLVPLLVLPDYQGGGGCLSCGISVGSGHFRCQLCVLAVALALDMKPNE